MNGFISDVWFLQDHRWAFQRCGNVYSLYDQDGDFVKSFGSFKAMTDYIRGKDAELILQVKCDSLNAGGGEGAL